MTLRISWFSAGVSSAVATKLAINEIDEIIYTHIDDQHEDTMRFVRDCELWFGKPVTVLQSPLKSVEEACRYRCYVNGIRGAACTRMLKRTVRKQWESEHTEFGTIYFWGFDLTERSRCERLKSAMPERQHKFPLIEYGHTKEMAHEILQASGIKRPAMYDLGYQNNNCIGCVKGGMGYWNKIRIDFPKVFQARAKMERLIGGTCLKQNRKNPNKPASEDNTVKLYLDELDPERGRQAGPICDDCGIMCELIRLT